jgi:hypothetical protein
MGEAAGRLVAGLSEVDVPARRAVSLMQALVVLGREREKAAAAYAAFDAINADLALVEPVAATGDLVVQGEVARGSRRSVRGRVWPRSGRRVRLVLAVGTAVLCISGGATATSLWLAPAGNRLYGFNPGLSLSSPPVRQLEALAVLRRQQTAVDRGSAVRAALADVNNFTTGLRSNYVRILGRTREGPVVLVPVVRRAAHAATVGAQPAIRDALCVYYPFGGHGSNTHCWSTRQLFAGEAVATIGAHEYGLVPDGVRSVRVSLGAWTRSVRVAGNFFDVELSIGRGGAGRPPVPVAPTVTFSRSSG